MEQINLSCKKCGLMFSVLGKNKIREHCSRICSNSRSWTEEDKKKKSISAKSSLKLKEAIEKNKVQKVEKKCKCGNIFFIVPSRLKQQFCSKECSNLYKKRKGGGYRENSGRSKFGYYKGIYCGSTYELCWVIYNLDHNIPFKRFQGYLTNGELKYYPDFLLDDNFIIEIKGFEDKEKVLAKCLLAKEKGYQIQVLYKNDLKKHFKYVKETYHTNKYHTLYDDFKPKFNYLCSFCKKEFNRDKIAKSKDTLCSKSCSMKFNRLKK